MKKLAINFLKSADEKLRSLGKVQNQSATIDQTEKFTFVRHLQQAPPSLQQLQRQQQERQRQKEKEAEQDELNPPEEQEHNQQQLKQQQQKHQKQRLESEGNAPKQLHGKFVSKPTDSSLYDNIPARSSSQQRSQQQQLRTRFIETADNAIGSSPKEDKHNSDNSAGMAERAIARNSRRERNKTNVHRTTEEIDKAEARRRSRSEGPSRRLRQSMEVREGGGRNQGREMWNINNGQYKPDSGSEDEIFHKVKKREESDSDSDRQKWVKNPLVVRRVKKSDKTRSLEKRHSAADLSGGGSSNRNSLVMSSRGVADDKVSSGGDNSGSREGTGSRSSQKFQRLEEMRKKRINMSVTSDEENTPASRISRLRQRAIQSGLGEQPRPLSTQGLSRTSGARNDVSCELQQSPKVSITPYTGSGTFLQQNQFPGSNRFSMSNAHQPQQPLQRSVSNAAPNRTVFQQNQNHSQLNAYQNQDKPGQFFLPNPVQKSVSPRPVPSSVQPTHSAFNTIPDHHSHISRALYNSSPEVNKRQFMPQGRIPSADSIHDAPPFPNSPKINQFSQRGVKTANQSPSFVSQNRTFAANQQRQQQYQQQQQQQPLQQQTKPLSYSFQELRASRNRNPNPLGMRMQSTSSSHEEPAVNQQHKIPKNSIPQMLTNQYSEDSLDELIESNIQYLDREIDKAKAKRLSNIPTTKPSAFSDPRNTNGTFPYTNISKSSNISYKPFQPQTQQSPILQVKQNSNVQFQVSLGSKPQFQTAQNQLTPPTIHIARSASDCFDESQDPKHNDPYRHIQPDVVPFSGRKYSYETSRLQRPGSDHFEREDLSKSDSQLNAPYLETVPYIVGNSLHPEQAYTRGCISDVNLASAGGNLEVPLLEKGMFSDVDYDIEVSERVKKWEKYMKKPIIIDGSKKLVNLSAIQEKQEGEQLMLPSEIRKSVILSKKGGLSNPHNQDVSSSTTNLSTGEPNSPNMLSIETNAKRFFHVIQDPQTGPKLELQSHSMSSVLQAPINIKLDRSSSNSSSDLRHFFSNPNNSALPHHGQGPIKAIHSQPVHQAIGYGNYSAPQSQDEGTPIMRRSNRLTVLAKPEDRSSRYHEELEEISNVKDSVINLRRRFDPDSATITSEDDQRSVVSTASANLSRPSNHSPNIKDQEQVDWTSMIPGMESKIKESDVWSPNLESTTAGIAVSIERVKARTLQTIPFSEDPFWKEIEKMTSFDPNSESDHYSTATSGMEDGMIKPHHAELTASSHSSTLPSQPRQTMSSKERLQRSKSLYTPNITPLTINVDKTKVSSSNALDEVLDDIRTSMERQQQLSPKKRTSEKNTWSSIANSTNHPYKVDSGKVTFITQPQIPTNIQSVEAKKLDSGSIMQMRAEQPALPSKQPLQFYQQQRSQMLKESQPQQNRQSQMNPGSNNGYQLDLDLLKQKLLKTGLVVETDTEEPTPPPLPPKSSSREFIIPSSLVGPSSDHIPNNSVPPYHQIQTQSSLSAPQSRKESFLSKSGVHSGSSALDDIQRALASFKSNSYQPGPDSLYGTSELEAFNSSGMDTTRGPSTVSTGWTYQPQPKHLQDSTPTQPSNQPSRKLEEVNRSMDDLKDLAQSVETRINSIKNRLHAADENSLDTILSSLKKFSPDSKFSQEMPASFDDYYNRKKSKLSSALSELDRIHSSLDLKQNRPDMSVIPPQPRSEHLRPMQMRISSMYISGLQSNDNDSQTVDKEVDSEFDVISKSFQAIIDEVNKTSNVLSRSNSNLSDIKENEYFREETQPSNVAPETQKKTFTITLQGNNSKKQNESVPETAGPKSPPQTAPKPQIVKPKSGRFRSKFQESEDSNAVKGRSKSVPELDFGTAVIKNESTIDPSHLEEGSGKDKPVSSGNTNRPTATYTPPPARARTRVRPVKDNKIIQDDRASRKDRILGMPPSPQPSPKLSRKIVFNNNNNNNNDNLDLKIEPPTMFQDAKDDDKPDSPKEDLETQVKTVKTSQADGVPKNVGSQSTIPTTDLTNTETNQIKMAPPTLVKPVTAAPSNRESQIPVPAAKTTTASLEKHGPPSSPGNSRAKLKVNLAKAKDPKSGQVSNSGISVSPTSVDDGKPKLDIVTDSKDDAKEKQGTNVSSSSKAKRTVGSGVALMMDKFKNNSDSEESKVRSPKPARAGITKDAAKTAEQINKDKITSPSLSDKRTKPTMKYSLAKRPGSPKSQIEEKENTAVPNANNKPSLNKIQLISNQNKKLSGPNSDKISLESGSSSSSSPITKIPPNSAINSTDKPSSPSIRGRFTKGQKENQDGVISYHKTYETPKATVKSIQLKPSGKSGQTADCKVVAHVAATSPDHKTTIQPIETKTRRGLPSPKLVRRRIRPSHRKIQTESLSSNPGSSGEESLKQRPHSFHELVSNLPGQENELRKYLSVEGLLLESPENPDFRSEQVVNTQIKQES